MEPGNETPPPLPETDANHKVSHGWFEPSRPVWRYVLRMGVTALLGAVAVATVISLVVSDPRLSEGLDGDLPWYFPLVAVVVAPPAETFIMALFFKIAGFVTKNALHLSIASALFWGLLHTPNAPINGIAVVWPFYIMSRAYLAWRPNGFWKAYGITTLIHATHNAIPMTAFVLLRFFPDESNLH